MLKFLKNFIIATGIVLIGGAIAFMVVGYININYIVGELNKAELHFTWKPLYWVFLAAAAVLSLVGAFLLGLGLGIPRQTLKQRLKMATETSAASDHDLSKKHDQSKKQDAPTAPMATTPIAPLSPVQPDR
ncbi:MAG: hypothetical protein FWG15_07050 [Propionibacteriaceae bacterium]|nr:hypothetical protein [Propionibacteriaceae bacterium]